MYTIFGHIPLDHCKRVGHSLSGSLATWPSYFCMGVACCARDCRVITRCWLAIAYLCEMTLARISAPPDLNWPTWSHSLTRLCRHHMGSTRVAARWTIRLTFYSRCTLVAWRTHVIEGQFWSLLLVGITMSIGGWPTTRKLSYCQGTVEPVVHPWFRWPSECAELYGTLALCPTCQTNFSPSFSSSLDLPLLPSLNAPPLVFALLARRFSFFL